MPDEQEKGLDVQENYPAISETDSEEQYMSSEVPLNSTEQPPEDIAADGFAAENMPMFYRDVVGEEERHPQNDYRGFSEDDLIFPPFEVVKKRKSILFLKSFLWMLSVILVSLAIFFVFQAVQKSNVQDIKQDNEKIPYNRTQTSYAEDNSLPDAPQVSADPDGPQISTVSRDEEVSGNIVNDAYKKAAPSIVCITSYKPGSDYVLNKLGDGSGIILSENGYIATNSHVVDDSTATGVMVTVFDGSQYLGTVIGVDKKTDLAVLKIDAKGLLPAEFSDSDKLFVGQEVYAIGNPGGANFSNSLTKGTVSALNRILANNGYVRYIQTDAAINPGNSGGALINESGQVIGMNTSKIVSTNYEGMGFSIPGNKVAEIINELIKYGYVSDRAAIGIEGATCNLYESKLKNIPQGMVITKISAASPLMLTSAREQDIITAINGVRVKSAYEFIDELSKFKPGDTVTLSLFRAAKNAYSLEETFDVQVKLIGDSAE